MPELPTLAGVGLQKKATRLPDDRAYRFSFFIRGLIQVLRDEREVVWRLKKVQRFLMMSDIQKNS